MLSVREGKSAGTQHANDKSYSELVWNSISNIHTYEVLIAIFTKRD